MGKIGENALSQMATQGLEEIRAANSGQMAMDSPPIQPAEPQMSSYEQALSQQAAMAELQPQQDQSMDR